MSATLVKTHAKAIYRDNTLNLMSRLVPGRYSNKYPFRMRSETADIAITLSMQPWDAFRPDGVIMFSDILTPLPALGIEFDVIRGKGPLIAEPIKRCEALHLGIDTSVGMGTMWLVAMHALEFPELEQQLEEPILLQYCAYAAIYVFTVMESSYYRLSFE